MLQLLGAILGNIINKSGILLFVFIDTYSHWRMLWGCKDAKVGWVCVA